MHIEEKSMTDSIVSHISLINYIHFSASNRQAPGFGNIDYRSVINALRETKFNGVISFEILPLPDDMSATKQAIVYVKKLLNEV
jgi:sugar phosphate isomerase/epimerase